MLFALTLNLSAQDNNTLIFDHKADAEQQINIAVSKAKAENKNVLIQLGGNWCSWCKKFYNLINTDKKIDSIIKSDYVFILVNWSKDNKNPEIMKRLEYPQRFGFPVLVVLNSDGKRIHTQDSGLLELDKGYDVKKVIEFLKGWTVKAMNNEQ